MLVSPGELKKAFDKAKKTYESTLTSDDILAELIKQKEIARANPNKRYLMQTDKVDWVEAKKMRSRYMQLKDIAKAFGVHKNTISYGFKKRGIK